MCGGLWAFAREKADDNDDAIANGYLCTCTWSGRFRRISNIRIEISKTVFELCKMVGGGDSKWS